MVSVWDHSTDDMLAIVLVPYFQTLMAGESEICDTEKTHLAVGWEEEFMEDGKALEGSICKVSMLGPEIRFLSYSQQF